ncbi:MAG: hypothetical protein DRP81_06270, partial [Candidatus Omnitrophota bacterium]
MVGKMRKKFGRAVVYMIVGFMSGILFCAVAYTGYRKAKPFIIKVKHKLKERWIANLPKAKRVLILSDFEDGRQIKRWDTSGAKIGIVHEKIMGGKGAGELVFYPNKGAAAVKLEDFFEKNRKAANWSAYEVLVFDLYNPNKTKERIILQIKDNKGNRVKRNLYLNPGKKQRFEIDIAGLWSALYPNQIAQFNLFLWNNSKVKKFYLDNVKLVPEAVAQAEKRSIFASSSLPQKGENTYALGDYFAFNSEEWEREDGNWWIPLSLKNYLGSEREIDGVWRGGVPLPRGKIYNTDKFKVVDSEGRNLPFQTKVLAWWPDKSLKWVLVTVRCSLPVNGRKDLFLVYGKATKANFSSVPVIVRVKEKNDGLLVSNGIIQAYIPKGKGTLIEKLWWDGNKDGEFSAQEIVAHDINTELEYNKKQYNSANEENSSLKIEEEGPVSVCIRKEGWFMTPHRKKYCKFIVRIYFYMGEPYLRIKHTLIYTGYPENRYHYLYKGKRLPKNETIEQFGIEIPLGTDMQVGKIYYDLNNNIVPVMARGGFELFQRDDRYVSIMQNGQWMEGKGVCEGVVVLQGEKVSLGAKVKEFWQQYPKRIEYDNEKKVLRIDFWPKQAGELNFRTTEVAYGPEAVARGSAFGIAKTHDFILEIRPADAAVKQLVEDMKVKLGDIVLLPRMKWIAATSALGKLPEVDNGDKLMRGKELFLKELFDWGNRQIKRFRWYGMVDFGDTLSWYRQRDYIQDYGSWGWHPVGRWGWFNCEVVGNHTGALLQFWRTHEYDYYLFGARLARHIMDIDTCHYNTVANDPRLRGKIPDDYSQPGSMHRHNGNHWGGRNEETSHTNVTGLVYYYYLSGDERAREVIDEVGSFFLKERVTYFRHPDIAPQRSLANVLWGDVLLYELTMDEKYKKGADKFAEILYRGQRYDGAWLENYNPVKKRWEGKPSSMFMVNYTLPALIAYHQLTQNKAIKESILQATDYIMEQVAYTPYFDALDYSYWLSADDKYQFKVRERLRYFINHQRSSNDPMWNGMIYQKLYYSRVMEFLYHMPFATLYPEKDKGETKNDVRNVT